MKRIYPHKIQDNCLLANILDQYLAALKESPLHVGLRELSMDTLIPESVFIRLIQEKNGEMLSDAGITPTDYHILFANLLFRYPTVKIWEQDDRQLFFEI